MCLARDGAGFLCRGPLVCLRLEAGLLGSDDGWLLRLFLLRLAGRLGHLLSSLDRLDRRLTFLRLEAGLFGPDGVNLLYLLRVEGRLGRLLSTLDCLGHGLLGRPLGLSRVPLDLALLKPANMHKSVSIKLRAWYCAKRCSEYLSGLPHPPQGPRSSGSTGSLKVFWSDPMTIVIV